MEGARVMTRGFGDLVAKLGDKVVMEVLVRCWSDGDVVVRSWVITDSRGDELVDADTDEDGEDKSLDADDEREGEGLGLEEEEEVVPEGQQEAVPAVDTAIGEPLGLGYVVLRCCELAVEEDRVPSTFKVGQSSRSILEQQGADRVSAHRQPTLTTLIDPEDGRVYTDIPVYVPLAAPVQTPPSPNWLSGSLPISPSSLLELHGSILYDYTQYLDVLPPTLFADIDRDVRELYTRSGVVRDKIVSQRYMFRSLEREKERTAVTFGALWRLVLALEA
ncbi:hypothetical protein Tco_0276588 [Tanacetum coccineum]